MLFLFVLSNMLSQPIISGSGEETGRAIVSNFQDLQKAKKEVRDLGLKNAVTKIWDSVYLKILTKTKGNQLKSIKRKILRRSKKYLIGISQVKEKVYGNNQLSWSALYKIDVGRLIGDIKKRAFKLGKRKLIYIYKGTLLTKNQKSDLRALFPVGSWKVKFKKKKFPKRCRKEFCMKIDISKNDLEWKLQYFILKRKMKGAPSPFVVKSKDPNMLFVSIPPQMTKFIGMKPLDVFKVVVVSKFSGVMIMRLLYLLQKEEPGFDSLKSFSIMNDGIEVSFNVTKNVDKALLLKGLYLGRDVEVKRNLKKDGTVELMLSSNPESSEVKDVQK
jgi:hypothetical protein